MGESLAFTLLTSDEQEYVTRNEYDSVSIFGYAIGRLETRKDIAGLKLLRESNPSLFDRAVDPKINRVLLDLAISLGMATTLGEIYPTE